MAEQKMGIPPAEKARSSDKTMLIEVKRSRLIEIANEKKQAYEKRSALRNDNKHEEAEEFTGKINDLSDEADKIRDEIKELEEKE